MRPQPLPARISDPRGRRAEGRMVALGLAAAALHLGLYAVQPAPWRPPPVGHFLALRAAGYLACTAGLFAVYAAVLAACRRGALDDPRARLVALAAPALLHLGWLVAVPCLSVDVMSYVAQGQLGLTPGTNPFLDPASDLARSAIGPELVARGWRPAVGVTPYGVIWTQLEIAAVALGGSVPGAILVLKGIAVLAALGTGGLLWVLLAGAAPRVRLLGVLAWLWNPLVVAELSGEGHNDALLILFVVAALACCARRWPAAAVAALLGGVLTKYVPAMFGPAVLACLWWQRKSTARLAAAVLLGGVAALAVAAALYVPLWAGAATFQGIAGRGAPLSSASPSGALNWLLLRSPVSGGAGAITLLAVALPFVGFALWVSARVRDPAGLAQAAAGISLAYVLFASPDYWPWYACLPVALLLAAGPERAFWPVLVLSLSARLAAPVDVLYEQGVISARLAKGLTTGLGATLPLLTLAVGWLARRARAAVPAAGRAELDR